MAQHLKTESRGEFRHGTGAFAAADRMGADKEQSHGNAGRQSEKRLAWAF